MAANILVKFLGDGGQLGQVADGISGKLEGVAGKAGLIGAGVVGAAGVIGGALVGIGAKFDEAFDSLAVKTGATGDKLKGLEDSTKNVFKEVPAKLGDVSEVIGTLNQKLGDSGKPLEDLSKQILNLSHITGTDAKENTDAIAKAFQNWNVATKDQGSTLDAFFKASQSSGVSVSELATKVSENGVVLRQMGFDMNMATNFTTSLAQAGIDSSEVMPALSKEMATAAKEGRNAGDVFKETFDKIKSAPSDTEAAADAMQVFGAKAGPKFAAMIREGKLSLEQLTDTAEGASPGINETAANTADFAETFTILKNKVETAIEPIATHLFSALSDLATKIEPIAEEWFPKLGSAIGQVVDVVKTITRFLLDHKEILVGIGVAITLNLIPAFVAWAISAATAAAATIAAAAPVIALGVVVAALVAGVIYAYNHFAIFKETVDTVWMVIKDYLWPWIQKIVDIVRDVLVGTIAVVIGYIKLWWEAFQTLYGVFNTVVDTIEGGVKKIVGFFTGIGDKIKEAAGDMWGWISEGLHGAANAAIDIWNRLADTLTIDLPSVSIFGHEVGGGHIGLPHLPHFAAGALVDMPTLAVVGDSGPGNPEIVSPETLMRKIIREENSGAGGVHIGTLQVGIEATAYDVLRELSWLSRQSRV